MGLSPGWSGAGTEAQCQTRVPWEGSLPLPRAIASMMGTWPDQVQDFGRALHFPWFQLKQASVQIHLFASHHVACAHLVWIELENLEPTEAMPEGEGDCSLGR